MGIKWQLSMDKKTKFEEFKEYFDEERLNIFLDQEHIKKRTANRLLFNLFRAYPYSLQLYHNGKLSDEANKIWQNEDKETQELAFVISEDIKRLKGKIYITSLDEFYNLSTREQWYLLSTKDKEFIHYNWLQI